MSYRPAMLHRLAKSIPYIDSWAPYEFKNTATDLLPCACPTAVHALLQCLPYYNACPTTVHALPQRMPYYSACPTAMHVLLQCMPYLSACPDTVHALLQCMPCFRACPTTVHALLQCMPHHSACPCASVCMQPNTWQSLCEFLLIL